MYLNCHSTYSFKYGTMSPKVLLENAAKIGVKRLALTDINSTSGCFDFLREAKAFGVEPTLGIDFRNGAEPCFIALAKNRKGYTKINSFLAKHLHSKEAIPSEAPNWKNVVVIYPLHKRPVRSLHTNEYIGISPEQWLKSRFMGTIPYNRCVALCTVTFRNQRDYNAHRLLRAIDNNTLLTKLSPSELGDPAHTFLPPTDISKRIDADVLNRTEALLEECTLSIPLGKNAENQNQRTYTRTKEGDWQIIQSLAEQGLYYRFPNPDSTVRNRLQKELEIIRDKNFISYFLMNWDIVHYARRQGYFYVGRGSGANSLLAYILRITDVDPIELDLYFERFINPSRNSPPDFDIDFSWRDRQDVTRYIFERFENVALLGAFSTFQQRATTHEIAKVVGLPAHEIKAMNQRHNRVHPDSKARKILEYGNYISGMPSHLTVHSSGIIITENSIHSYGSTILPPKGFPTAHFDMYQAEDAGIHKYDILGQRGLAKIKESITIIRENQPEKADFDVHDIQRFKEDERVREMLMNAKTIGCFYVESPAMRGLLTKLRVTNYTGLVAASSIIRPGVSKSGMMQEYIRRYRKPELRTYVHPLLKEILGETFGVMVYQEDVLRVAHFFAGLTLAEADILRRGMSWKFKERNEFWRVKDKFFSNCLEKGYGQELTEEIWRQIDSFGNYAFAKGHSASYAVESYQSLFLKAYFPLEYMVATINNFGGFYRTELYVHEARLHGGMIEPPCVNQGNLMTTIEGKTIVIGFQHLKGLETQVSLDILEERRNGGPFKSLQDLTLRVSVSLDQLLLLVRIGAFRFTGKSKKELLWEAHFVMGKTKKSRQPQAHLFAPQEVDCALPQLETHALEDAFDEIELLGFPLCSPFNLLANSLPCSTTMANIRKKPPGQAVELVGYLINIKRTSTKSTPSRTMYFGTFLDLDGNFVDTVHFPSHTPRYPFSGGGCYLIRGVASEDFGHISIDTRSIKRLEMVNLDQT